MRKSMIILEECYKTNILEFVASVPMLIGLKIQEFWLTAEVWNVRECKYHNYYYSQISGHK